MQSLNEAPKGVANKPSIFQKNSRVKGKENCLNPQTCLQQDKQKQALQTIVLKDPQKSRLPVLSTARAPPDFQKMHQAWENRLQKGKTVSKKSCTRPQPFNFSQKGERFRVPTVMDVGLSGNPPASHRVREPLTEVVLGPQNLECKDVKDGSEVEFKADPAALSSILSNVGVLTAATGKLSLAQRVPMRMLSTAQSITSKNMMVRSSMYTMPSSQTASSHLDRMSFFSKMHVKGTWKANEQKPLLVQNEKFYSHIPDTSSKEPAASKKNDELQSQENPVLQQMNLPPHVLASGTTSPSVANQEVSAVKPAPLSLVTENVASSVLSAVKCEKPPLAVDASAEENFLLMKTVEKQDSADFVVDSHALASILSNTGVTIGNCGKLSLAQRVPAHGRNATLKGNMTCSVLQVTTPKFAYGRISNIAVPLKDIVLSTSRVPKTPLESSGGSARRVHQPKSPTVKFFQPNSGTSKQPIFPKTPRALALEMANKRLEAEQSDTQTSAQSTVKWADQLSPSPVSEVVCESEPYMEQVAMRLFVDGDCPGESDKKKEPADASDRLEVFGNSTASVQQHMKVVLSENPVTNADGAAAGDSQALPLQMKLHPAPLSLPNTSDPSVPCPSSVSSVKTYLPLSFLSHPAVQALRSCTLGPHSLPKIARLRLQATMSSKQRFWDTYLDEECAFYTSRGTASSCRSCADPVSTFLEKQEDMHFTPIVPGDP